MERQLFNIPEIELRRRDLLYLVPGGLIVLASLLLFHLLNLPENVRGFFDYYPFLVLVAGIFFSWRFNNTRLVFSLLVLLVADQVLTLAPGGPARAVAIAATQTLLPLNLAMIGFFVERGLLTQRGLLRLCIICLQPTVLLLLYRWHSDWLTSFFSLALIPWDLFHYLPLPQIPFAALLLGGGLLLAHFLWQPGALNAGLLWALVAAIAPLELQVSPPTMTHWFASAGLILTISLVESSHRMAYRDELTGLYTRRALNETLLQIDGSYTIAMVDIDHFKRVNDTYGHDVGDQVLKMVASHLEGVGGSKSFRYGGEEFILLFANRTMQEVVPQLEELCMEIAMSGFKLRDPYRPPERPEGESIGAARERLWVTVSVGVAERREPDQTAIQVIRAADGALYRAKDEGRNRICRAGMECTNAAAAVDWSVGSV